MAKTFAAKVQCASDDWFLQRLFSIQSLGFGNFPNFQHEGICDIYFYFIFKGYKCSYAGLAPAESRCEVIVQYHFHPQKGTELHGGKG